MNPLTPVLVGVSQLLERGFDPEAVREPIDLMLAAAKAAAVDTQAPDILSAIDSVRVVRGVWRYKQPAGYLAKALGLEGAELVGTPFGGNSVQALVSQTALVVRCVTNRSPTLVLPSATHCQGVRQMPWVYGGRSGSPCYRRQPGVLDRGHALIPGQHHLAHGILLVLSGGTGCHAGDAHCNGISRRGNTLRLP